MIGAVTRAVSVGIKFESRGRGVAITWETIWLRLTTATTPIAATIIKIHIATFM
jgi:hypothetical protein